MPYAQLGTDALELAGDVDHPVVAVDPFWKTVFQKRLFETVEKVH